MGTRRATREDLLKLIDYVNQGWENHSKLDALGFKLYHEGCRRGRIKCPNNVNLICTKCKASWGKDRPRTWTDQEISDKFFCEIPPDKTLYTLSMHPSGNYHHLTIAPVPDPKNEKVKATPKDEVLDKIADALGLGSRPSIGRSRP